MKKLLCLYTLMFCDQGASWSSSCDELKNFAINIFLKLVIKSRTVIALKNKVHHHTDNNNIALDQEQEEIMYAFYKCIETQNQLSTDFLSFQRQVSVYVRNSLVDWLTSLHFSLDLLQPTLFLVVNIVNRFLSVEVVSTNFKTIVFLFYAYNYSFQTLQNVISTFILLSI